MHKLAHLSVLSVAAGLLTAIPVTSAAADAFVTLGSADLNCSETKSAGHNDLQRHRVHVYTEGSTDSDKAACYFQVAMPLGDAGEPTLDWTVRAQVPSQPPVSQAIPGAQIVFDADDVTGNGNDFNILVGEPVYGGAGQGNPAGNWWLTGGSSTTAKAADPSGAEDGGTGSEWFGTLDQWRAALPSAQVYAGGWSLGSGVYGDGFISEMTYGETTYEFSSLVTPEPTVVSATDKAYDETTTDCRTASVHVGVAALETGEAADPNDSTVRIRVGVDGSPVFGPTNLTYGESYDRDFTFSQRWKPSVIRVYFDRELERMYKVERNCSMTSTLLTTIRGGLL